MPIQNLNSVEYFQRKSELENGTYQITEHDGEINYVELSGHGTEVWYSENEYVEKENREIAEELVLSDDWDFLHPEDMYPEDCWDFLYAKD